MDPAEGSKDAKKKTGWRWRSSISVDGWRCPAWRARDMHPLCCPARNPPEDSRSGPGWRCPLFPPGPRWPAEPTRPGECNVDLQIPPFRPQSPTASVFGPFSQPAASSSSTRGRPLCPRSARRCGCRQSTALQFSRPHPVSKSTRFASDDAPLSPPPPPQAPPRQSPTVVPRTPARHHTQARLASPTTLTPLLFPHSAPTRTTPLASNIEATAPKILDDNHDDTKRPRAPRRPSPLDDDDAPRLDVGFSMLPCRVAPAPSERRNISVPSGGKQLGSRATSMQPP